MHTHTRRSGVARIWAALAALVVVPATLAVSTSSAGAAGSNTLTVKAGEYTYQLKGSPKAGWTEITFENSGVEDHMLAMFKLKKGTTNAQLKKAVLSNDQSALEKIAAPGGDPTVFGTPAPLSPKASTTTTMTPDEVLRQGDVVSGGKDRNHWIENVGSETAVALVCSLGK